MRDMRLNGARQGELPSAGYEEKEIMYRKHQFRAAFFADLRNSLRCGFGSATPNVVTFSETRRGVQRHFRCDWERCDFGGGYNASA